MTRLRPAIPFPPVGGEPPGVVDLGIRLRDTLFQARHVARGLRPVLLDKVADLAETSGPSAELAVLTQALIDTWPCAGLIDEARLAWARHGDERALPVLARVALIHCLAYGAEPGWPRAGQAWTRRIVGNRIITKVERLTTRDGSRHLSRMFDVPRIEGGRGEHDIQRHIDPSGWDRDLVDAPPGTPGPQPEARAEAVQLPGLPDTLAAGRLEPVTLILWEAPYHPVTTTASAALILNLLDGTQTADQLAVRLKAPRDAVRKVVGRLIDQGAATDPRQEPPRRP